MIDKPTDAAPCAYVYGQECGAIARRHGSGLGELRHAYVPPATPAEAVTAPLDTSTSEAHFQSAHVEGVVKIVEEAISADASRMIAWKAYQQTEDWANTRYWAHHSEHVEGSLWAAFEAGFRAALEDQAMSEQHDERLAENAESPDYRKSMMYWHERAMAAEADHAVTRWHRDAARAELAAANAKIKDAGRMKDLAARDRYDRREDAQLASEGERLGSPCTVCEHTVGHDEDCPAYRKALRAKPAQSEGK